jgi:hypothetical protein
MKIGKIRMMNFVRNLSEYGKDENRTPENDVVMRNKVINNYKETTLSQKGD